VPQTKLAATLQTAPFDARIDEIRGDDTRSAWLQRLIDRDLDGQSATQAATGGPITLPTGEPCPSAVWTPDASNATPQPTASAASSSAMPAQPPSAARQQAGNTRRRRERHPLRYRSVIRSPAHSRPGDT
jgi:hypothetical protein